MKMGSLCVVRMTKMTNKFPVDAVFVECYCSFYVASCESLLYICFITSGPRNVQISRSKQRYIEPMFF